MVSGTFPSIARMLSVPTGQFSGIPGRAQEWSALMSDHRLHRKTSLPLLVALSLVTMAFVPACAQSEQDEAASAQGEPGAQVETDAPSDTMASPPNAMQQLQAMQARMQHLNQELMEIQEATIEANPGLEARRDALIELVDAKMIEAGHQPEAQRDEIDAMAEALDSTDLVGAARDSMMQEIRSEQQALQQAQQQAMQAPDVQEQMNGLNEDLVVAMEEQNPRTTELIQELQSTQQRFQALLQQAMQQQMQQQQGPPPMQQGEPDSQ